MAFAKTRSSKRSATNSGSAKIALGRSANVWPPDGPILFVDRCAWSRKLGDALRVTGVPLVAHSQRFAHDTPDADWLAEVGKSGWIVLTRDKQIRRKSDEIEAVVKNRVILFTLAGGNMSAFDTARLVVSLIGKMYRLAHSTSPPAIYTIGASGAIGRIKLRP